MLEKNIAIVEMQARPIVMGLHQAYCPDVLAHAKMFVRDKDKVTGMAHEYQVYAQAYLPLLELDFPTPVINISEVQKVADSEVKDAVDLSAFKNKVSDSVIKKINQSLVSRTVEIIYTSKVEQKPPFSLWSFFVHYSVPSEESVPFIEIKLRNTDPKTTRGTVTTVQNEDELP